MKLTPYPSILQQTIDNWCNSRESSFCGCLHNNLLPASTLLPLGDPFCMFHCHFSVHRRQYIRCQMTQCCIVIADYQIVFFSVTWKFGEDKSITDSASSFVGSDMIWQWRPSSTRRAHNISLLVFLHVCCHLLLIRIGCIRRQTCVFP